MVRITNMANKHVPFNRKYQEGEKVQVLYAKGVRRWYNAEILCYAGKEIDLDLYWCEVDRAGGERGCFDEHHIRPPI